MAACLAACLLLTLAAVVAALMTWMGLAVLGASQTLAGEELPAAVLARLEDAYLALLARLEQAYTAMLGLAARRPGRYTAR